MFKEESKIFKTILLFKIIIHPSTDYKIFEGYPDEIYFSISI